MPKALNGTIEWGRKDVGGKEEHAAVLGESRRSGAILIVEDDECCRSLLVDLLCEAGFETVDVATGEEALAAARARRPVLAVVDVRLPGLSGYEVCRVLKHEFGAALPVVFVSGERTESFDRVAGLLLGADDYLVKPFAADELLARVRALVRRAPQQFAAASLTVRELEVLGLLAGGSTQADIAAELAISRKTVGKHLEHILGKLGVHSRTEAVAVAYRDKLIAD